MIINIKDVAFDDLYTLRLYKGNNLIWERVLEDNFRFEIKKDETIDCGFLKSNLGATSDMVTMRYFNDNYLKVYDTTYYYLIGINGNNVEAIKEANNPSTTSYSGYFNVSSKYNLISDGYGNVSVGFDGKTEKPFGSMNKTNLWAGAAKARDFDYNGETYVFNTDLGKLYKLVPSSNNIGFTFSLVANLTVSSYAAEFFFVLDNLLYYNQNSYSYSTFNLDTKRTTNGSRPSYIPLGKFGDLIQLNNKPYMHTSDNLIYDVTTSKPVYDCEYSSAIYGFNLNNAFNHFTKSTYYSDEEEHLKEANAKIGNYVGYNRNLGLVSYSNDTGLYLLDTTNAMIKRVSSASNVYTGFLGNHLVYSDFQGKKFGIYEINEKTEE